jgi:hypothetical protein
MATNYDINYDDERFKNVENEKNTALNQMNNAYNQMIGASDQFYTDQKNLVNDYKDTQTQLQQQQTDFTIQQIEQQKAQANKDYTKEQKGAYVDWQKQSNQYGVNAEQMAMQGLTNTGFSESSQVSMYNTYQNRVSTARETYNLAVQNFDNSITQARLANSSKLAEIAFNALQQSLQLSLEGFQYKNTLILDQINKQQEVEDRYYSIWQNVQSQINTENALAEQIRQYDQQLAYYKEKDAKEYELEIKKLEEEKRQAQQAQANWEKEFALAKSKAYSSGGSGGSSGGSSSKKKTTLDNGNSGSSWLQNTTNKVKNTASSVKNAVSNTQKNASSAEYNKVLSSARTVYNAGKLTNPAKATQFVDDIVARSNLSDSQITKLYKSLGIK